MRGLLSANRLCADVLAMREATAFPAERDHVFLRVRATVASPPHVVQVQVRHGSAVLTAPPVDPKSFDEGSRKRTDPSEWRNVLAESDQPSSFRRIAGGSRRDRLRMCAPSFGRRLFDVPDKDLPNRDAALQEVDGS